MKAELKAQTNQSVCQPVSDDIQVDDREGLDADLSRLREMLARADVEGARAWVVELQTRWPDSPQVRHYQNVLAPPRVSVRHGHRGPSRQQERAWIREHAREYPGQWLAVLEDQLLAADPDLEAVLSVVRETAGTQRPLLHFQPKSSA